MLSRSWQDLVDKTTAALDAGYEQIVAVGGDGTLNGVANGFLARPDTKACLAVANLGTGCDYWRSLGHRGDWADLLDHHEVRRVDAGRLTFRDGSRGYLNCATAGLAADVVRRHASVPSWIPGSLSYAIPALGSLFLCEPRDVEIVLDGNVIREPVLGLFLAKGIYAGGGMRLGGNVSFEDARLDVTVIRGMGLLKTLPRFPKVFSGNFRGDEGFVKTTANRVEVRAPSGFAYEADGELLGSGAFEATVLPRAVPVCFPRYN